MQDYCRLALQRWQDFQTSAAQSDEITILECCFLQNPLTVMLARHNADPALAREQMEKISRIIEPLIPLVIYLKPRDVRAALLHAREQRPREWADFVTWYLTGQAYGQAHHLQGYEGVAIRKYTTAVAGRTQYPASLHDLLKDGRSATMKRHLRRKYKDPMTGEDFILLANTPAAGCITTWKNFIITGNCSNYGAVTGATDMVAWSALGDFTDFVPCAATQAGWNRLLDVNRRIIALMPIGDALAVYKATGIYLMRFQGPPVIVFRWSGEDPVDAITSIPPEASRWVIIPSNQDLSRPGTPYASFPDSLHFLPARFQWSPWRRWDAADSPGLRSSRKRSSSY